MSITTEIERIQNAKASIKTAIENKGVEVGNGTIDTYASKIDEISVGSEDSFHDAFWDVWQDNGQRKDYAVAFQNAYWTEKNFYPKYDLKPTATQNMFVGTKIKIDLRERLKECGIVFDLSNVTSRCNFTFNSSYFEALPTLDFTNFPVNMYPQFQGCLYLHTIEKVILTRNHTYTNGGGLFNNCSKLENVVIEGEIGNSISFASCSLLSNDSVQSVIDHLIDLTGATAQILTVHADVKAKIEANPTLLASITSKNWTLA